MGLGRFFRKVRKGNTQPSTHPDSKIGVELRAKMLATSSDDLGMQATDRFPNVFGMLMDWSVGTAIATIVSICDGNASLCTTSTFGIIGGIGHERVRNASVGFVIAGEKSYAAASPTSDFFLPFGGKGPLLLPLL